MERFQHGGNVYEDPPAGGWLDFSANINPIGLSAEVREAVCGGVENVVHYPDPRASVLKQAISLRYSLPQRHLILGNGASELFYLFFHMIRPKRALIPVPSFSEYERAALAASCKVERYIRSPQDGFSLHLDDLAAHMQAGDAVLIGNPNNPTGTCLSFDALRAFARQAAHRSAWVIVDESFLQFRKDFPNCTVHPLVKSFGNVIVIESLTKFYAIPGLRLGFASAAPEIIRHLERGKDVWNVNSLAQLAGTAALRATAYQAKTRDIVATEAAFLHRALAGMKGIRTSEPSVNFFLLEIGGTELVSWEFARRMRKKGILVRDCANYPGLDGKSYVRIAVRMHAENERLLQAMEELV